MGGGEKSEDEVKGKIKELFEGIKGLKLGIIIDNNLDVIRKVGARDITRTLGGGRKQVFAVIIDGTVTGTLIKACEDNGVKYLAATNFGNVKDTSLKLVSL
jgi:hypothetical protein